jgi:DNA-binding MarR family transcriptional regulator
MSTSTERTTLREKKNKREPKSINFRVHALASSLFKGAQQYYGQRFQAGVPEMRILSNLDSEGVLAASQLVELTAMDKALVSRLLNALHARGLLAASAPVSDPRRRNWRLSRSGHRLVSQLRPLWRRREAIIQAGLSVSEQRLLGDMLHRLFLASEALREAETKTLCKATGPSRATALKAKDDTATTAATSAIE